MAHTRRIVQSWEDGMNAGILWFRGLLSFSIVGVVVTALSTAVYEGLVFVSVPALLANLVAFIVGVSVAYELNLKFTYKLPRTLSNATGFLIARVGTLVLQSGFLWALLHFHLSNKYWAMIELIPVMAVLSFILTTVSIKLTKRRDG